MKKLAILLSLSLLLTACDLGFPKMTVNYDNLPHGKIKEYITKTFPNEPEKEALSKMIYAQLSGDKNADNIKKLFPKSSINCKIPLCCVNFSPNAENCMETPLLGMWKQ